MVSATPNGARKIAVQVDVKVDLVGGDACGKWPGISDTREPLYHNPIGILWAIRDLIVTYAGLNNCGMRKEERLDARDVIRQSENGMLTAVAASDILERLFVQGVKNWQNRKYLHIQFRCIKLKIEFLGLPIDFLRSICQNLQYQDVISSQP